jgi:two-component system, OmpR family, sensor histidine kinase TctE
VAVSESLRGRLLARIAIPLLLLIAVDTGISYLFAYRFASSAYDHWLLDSARSLASQTKVDSGQAFLRLPKEAIEVFEWDEHDRIVYKVANEAGELILGDQALAVPEPPREVQRPVFFDGVFESIPIRGVVIRAKPSGTEERVVIAVAETLNKRRALTAEILAIALIPQVLLLLSAALLIWSGVTGGLRSLMQVSLALERKDHRDLSPVPTEEVPREIRPIIVKTNELFERLAAALSAQRKFIADAAHQLRTPLAALKLQVESLEREPMPQAMRQRMESLRHASDRTIHLAQQLLTLARAEPGFNPGQAFVAVDLAEVARETGERWAVKALDAGIELELDAPAAAVMIHGDPTLLSELVSNLIDNAMRHAPATPSITIRVESVPAPTLVVEDAGPGIAAQATGRVFERFYRGSGVSSEGSGLGLAIVREIVLAHGGSVSVEARPAFPGTRFTARFPVPDQVMPAAAQA